VSFNITYVRKHALPRSPSSKDLLDSFTVISKYIPVRHCTLLSRLESVSPPFLALEQCKKQQMTDEGEGLIIAHIHPLCLHIKSIIKVEARQIRTTVCLMFALTSYCQTFE